MCIGCFRRWKWRSCCRRITNPACRVKNAGCKVRRRAALFGLRKAQQLVSRSRGIFKAANVVLAGAKHLVRAAKRSLDLAVAFLEGVKRAYQIGTRALSAIARFGLGGVFDIKRVAFNVGLSTAATGHFRVSVTASILGRQKQVSLTINLRDITSIARKLGEDVIRGLKKYIS